MTKNLTRSMAGSERRPVASTRKMARCWGSSSTRSPRMSMYRRLVVVMNPHAVGAGLSRIAGEGAEVLHGLPGGGPNGGVVSGGVVPERGETGVVGGGRNGGVRRSDSVAQVDGGIANGIVAVDVEELTGRAAKTVKWYVVGVDFATTRTEDEDWSADVRRRGREFEAHAERHRVFDRGAEGVPTIEDPTWAVEPPAGALSPDGLGLLTVVVEEGDERGRPTMLNGATYARRAVMVGYKQENFLSYY